MGILGRLLGSEKAIEIGGNIIDDAFNTSQEKMEADQADTKSARSMQSDGNIGKLVELYSIANSYVLRHIIMVGILLDVAVDSVGRLIRPWITIHLVGGVFGYWNLPVTTNIDPTYQKAFWIVLTFWFGGRAVMKDIPKMLEAIYKLRKKMAKG